MVELIISLVVLLGIVGVAVSKLGKEDLARYQALKNKRRFSGKRLSLAEQEELDRLARKYWWY